MVQNILPWIILPKERGSLGTDVPTPENHWVQSNPGGCQLSSTFSLSQVCKRHSLTQLCKRFSQLAVESWQKHKNMVRSEENDWEYNIVCYKKLYNLPFTIWILIHLGLIFFFYVTFGTNCIGGFFCLFVLFSFSFFSPSFFPSLLPSIPSFLLKYSFTFYSQMDS